MGAADPAAGLGEPVAPGLIYAGQARAARWPSGRTSTSTLWTRTAGMNLGGWAEFLTLRRTFAAALRSVLDLVEEDDPPLVEWIGSHLRVIAVPVANADELGWLEDAVLDALDPRHSTFTVGRRTRSVSGCEDSAAPGRLTRSRQTATRTPSVRDQCVTSRPRRSGRGAMTERLTWPLPGHDVREGGLEPPRPRAADPKSAASAIPPLPRTCRQVPRTARYVLQVPRTARYRVAIGGHGSSSRLYQPRAERTPLGDGRVPEGRTGPGGRVG